MSTGLRTAATLAICGQSLQLLPERAVFWAERRTLVIADPHFGKDASFRSAGVPVPAGAAEDDIARLELCCEQTEANRLIILGDFYHNRASQTGETNDHLAAWRERRPDLEVTLVRGNHDRHAGDPPAELIISAHSPPLVEPPFVWEHMPGTSGDGYVIAGHVHPAVRVRLQTGGGVKLPCFRFGAADAILPAFGAFTGTARLTPGANDRIFAIGEQHVFEVPAKSIR